MSVPMTLSDLERRETSVNFFRRISLITLVSFDLERPIRQDNTGVFLGVSDVPIARGRDPSAPQFLGFLLFNLFLGGRVVRTLDLRSIGREFESWPLRYRVCNLISTCASVTKQYNLVPANGRWCLAACKVTVGLTSHWPCVTDNSGITTYGLMALKREMSDHPVGVQHKLPLRQKVYA